MSQPLAFYKREKSKNEQALKRLNRKIKQSSLIRTSAFLLTVFLAYLMSANTIILIFIILSGIILFTFLVIFHDRLVNQKRFVTHLVQINSIELDALEGNYACLPDGAAFIDPQHFFSNDIDLFGKGSFFQYLNRTTTASGKAKLAELLTENDNINLEEKQAAIQDLAQHPEWRQQFMALAKMVTVEVDHTTIVSWIKNYQRFLPASMKYIPYVFSGLSFGAFFLAALGIFPFPIIILWFFTGLGITMLYIKKLNHLYNEAGKMKSTFEQYHKLLNEIETKSLHSSILVSEQQKIITEKKKASVILMEFSKILNAFDQRINMLFGFLGNGFLLWDIHQGYKVERWIESYSSEVEKWFEVIAFFDAQISLSNYAFNHPQHTFPAINQDQNIMKAIDLGHPLISEKSRISNDFQIKNKDFIIITGANMAGKSTFLRTISLTIVMANVGLPVCAKKMDYSPIKLITSMRTTDSLAEKSSYFYAEIMRLRFIVDQMKDEHYFIVLDEILKGTNSKDKAIGSRKFVEKLVKSGSTGIIATHDLSLCEVEKEYKQIHNMYFDALIKKEALVFDYLLREGICVNMNASFLLKKMKVI